MWLPVRYSDFVKEHVYNLVDVLHVAFAIALKKTVCSMVLRFLRRVRSLQ